jgi:uncharacterized protein
MLFRRRIAPKFTERLRVALWPRRSWARSIRYMVLRLKRLPASPHRIALGFATGVFAVFTPFLGLQLIIGVMLAWTLRGSTFASLVGSFAGNPLPYPAIWLSTYNVGTTLVDGPATLRLIDLQNRAEAVGVAVNHASLNAVTIALQNLWTLVKPMAAGSLPIGGIAAILAYVSVRHLVGSARDAHRRRRIGWRQAQFSQ